MKKKTKKKISPSEIIYPVQAGLKEIGICPACMKPIKENDFKDKLSRKEFEISGLCQKCQDGVFK